MVDVITMLTRQEHHNQTPTHRSTFKFNQSGSRKGSERLLPRQKLAWRSLVTVRQLCSFIIIKIDVLSGCRVESRGVEINGSGDGVQLNEEDLQLQVKTDKDVIWIEFVNNQSKRMHLYYFQTNRDTGAQRKINLVYLFN